VFGDLDAATSDEVIANWEHIKKAEKGRTSVMDGIPVALPALAYAAKVLGKADDAVVDTGAPEGDEAVLGAELFGFVRRARAAGGDTEAAQRRTAAAYVERFRATESADDAGTP
jgi:XTP/dITP diphosphohydrolase